jgi:hypothetical protein
MLLNQLSRDIVAINCFVFVRRQKRKPEGKNDLFFTGWYFKIPLK